MPNESAIPLLEQHVRKPTGGDTALSSAALQALAQRPDLGSYYFFRIKGLVDQDSPEADEEMKTLFRFLAIVPNDEALMAVAEFLECDTRRKRNPDDPTELTPDQAAAQTLGSLWLPDAPVHKSPGDYTAEDYAAWRAWLASIE